MATDMRELVLVLASQRSGSTLLCRDLESLGGLGAPKEYFLDILGKNQRPGLGEKDVLEQISRGVTGEKSATGAVKLMVNYAPKIDAYIRGTDPVAPPRAIQNIIDWAQERFDRVCVFALVRNNSLDQAISRAVASVTDIWHRNEGALQGRDPYADVQLASAAINMAILEALPAVIRHKKIIRQIAKANPKICKLVTYETIAASEIKTSEILTAHATQIGLTPQHKKVSRNLQKLIDETRSQEIKSGFKAFMSQHLGGDVI